MAEDISAQWNSGFFCRCSARKITLSLCNKDVAHHMNNFFSCTGESRRLAYFWRLHFLSHARFGRQQNLYLVLHSFKYLSVSLSAVHAWVTSLRARGHACLIRVLARQKKISLILPAHKIEAYPAEFTCV